MREPPGQARCPSPDDLFAFTVGRLPADARERIACHIETCAACLTRLDQLHEESEPLIAQLRRPVPADLYTDGTRLAGNPPAAERSRETMGRPTVAGYEILRELGRGGMGVVYQARQVSLQRLVALKVILAGLHAGAEQKARFRIEAEAVAQLQHPNIVQIHEVGEQDGHAYLTLEFVDGGSLAQRQAGTPLPAAAAARLVETLARAMHHAHRRHIVHRDLKPANVLLTAEGTPKISDFGLAKRLEGEGVTGSGGAVMGTPSYMAPEQARGDTRQVGPAADIYALGAILYEMLTGRPPFKAATALETLQQVQNEEPVPPRRLQSGLPRDLETICLKCLHKEPVQRYADAEALAEDLRRFQAREPIVARPAGMVARGWKWARRRPAAVALVAVTGLALVGGVAGMLWYAQRERDRANQENKLRQEAQDVLQFFQDQVLAAARPENLEGGLGIHATIRAAVEAAEPKIADAFHDRPAVEASIRNTLGVTYWYLGESRAAIQQHQWALALRRDHLGPDHPDTLESLSNLANAYRAAGQLEKALPLYEQALAKRREKLGPDHPDTLTSMNNLAAAYQDGGELEKALPLFEQALAKRREKLGPDHPDTFTSMNNLATAYEDAGQLEKALPLYEQALVKRREKLGPDHPHTLNSMNNLAGACKAAGRLPEAVAFYEKALKGCTAKYGPDHPETLSSMNNVAAAYQAAGRLSEAVPLYEAALKARTAKLGPGHPDTLNSMNNLATAYRDADRWAEALPLFEEVFRRNKAQAVRDPGRTQNYLGNLARAYLHLKQPAKAFPLFQEFLAGQRQQLGPHTIRLSHLLAQVGQDFLTHGYFAEAEEVLREALTIREAKQPDDWTMFDTKSLLGASLLGQGKYAEAEPLLVKGYEGMKARAPAIPPPDKKRLSKAQERLVQLYEAWGKKEQAGEWRKRRDTDAGLAPPAE